MAVQRDLADQLLGLARDDEAAARVVMEADSAESMVGFHCQQAVEKALKAVLADDGVQFPYTHDIELLVELCGDAGAPLPEHLTDVDRLTPFAARIRYGTAPVPDIDLSTCLQWAAQAIGLGGRAPHRPIFWRRNAASEAVVGGCPVRPATANFGSCPCPTTYDRFRAASQPAGRVGPPVAWRPTRTTSASCARW